jgi:hypothetical protein
MEKEIIIAIEEYLNKLTKEDFKNQIIKQISNFAHHHYQCKNGCSHKK